MLSGVLNGLTIVRESTKLVADGVVNHLSQAGEAEIVRSLSEKTRAADFVRVADKSTSLCSLFKNFVRSEFTRDPLISVSLKDETFMLRIYGFSSGLVGCEISPPNNKDAIYVNQERQESQREPFLTYSQRIVDKVIGLSSPSID